MTTLTNRSKQLVAVTDAGALKHIAPGASVDVDGRQNWKDDLFVKAGWLEIEQDKPQADPEPETVKVETKPTRRKR
jgi:predicted ribosome-associated RNA-binding protein Tma20